MIETERLILRLPLVEDLGWQLAQLNTPAVMRHLGGVRDEAAVAQTFAANREALLRGEPGFWTITLRASGEPVGRCGLAPVSETQAPAEMQGGIQVGWSLAESHWGQGLASEAARAAITHGFTAHDLPWIWSQTSDSNAASSRLMLRLGLTRCPRFDYLDPDYPPEDNPTTIYRIERAEWPGL